ncbi:ribonuclease P protein component [Phormidium tenue FACHB-886]|nr:ribonuclease P protein component [Phormidium tenue FACHB-886]
MALPKQHRLRKRQDFSAVYQAGLRRSSAHLILRALRIKSTKLQKEQFEKEQPETGQLNTNQPPTPSQPTQIGVSISQKVSKRAVVRNRIKRRIRAAAHQLLPLLAGNWQIVIVVKPNAAQCGYEQILQELKQLFINAEVMDGH